MSVSSRSVRAFVLGGATVALVLVALPQRSGGGGSTPVTTERSAMEAAAALPGARAVRVQPIQPGNEPIQPIPGVREFFEDHLEIEYEAAKIELGRKLFHDPRLSHDDTISCASCHDLRFGGVDRSGTAIGVEGQIGPINTPTVFNAALNVVQFWDGRAEDLEHQADGPPNAPGEMASSWPEISAKLLEDAEIVALLREAYHLEGEIPSDLDKRHWLEAIADFERTLITPGAPFDAYLQGDEDAVGQAVEEGYQLFKDLGCIECHNGMAVGARSFQKLGRSSPYFGAHADRADLGRYNVTGREEDRHVFKVPGLRNVALTGPWFHDASQATLADAVRTMARVQLGTTLDDGDVSRIVAFLESLTGTYDERSLAATARSKP
jgi:cytochrome c peroxidase